MWVGDFYFVCMWLNVCRNCLNWFCHWRLQAIKQNSSPISNTDQRKCYDEVWRMSQKAKSTLRLKEKKIQWKKWDQILKLQIKEQMFCLKSEWSLFVDFRDTQWSPLHRYLCSLSPCLERAGWRAGRRFDGVPLLLPLLTKSLQHGWSDPHLSGQDSMLVFIMSSIVIFLFMLLQANSIFGDLMQNVSMKLDCHNQGINLTLHFANVRKMYDLLIGFFFYVMLENVIWFNTIIK